MLIASDRGIVSECHKHGIWRLLFSDLFFLPPLGSRLCEVYGNSRPLSAHVLALVDLLIQASDGDHNPDPNPVTLISCTHIGTGR